MVLVVVVCVCMCVLGDGGRATRRMDSSGLATMHVENSVSFGTHLARGALISLWL